MSMVRHHGNSEHVRERITKEEFVKSGKELIKMFDEKTQQKYYFKLFAAGKDYLTKDGNYIDIYTAQFNMENIV